MSIYYDMRCASGHVEESRFPDHDTYLRLHKAGLLICTHCEAPATKLVSAPTLVGLKGKSEKCARDQRDSQDARLALLEFVAQFKDVGDQFDGVVRDMIAEKIPTRPIKGCLTPEQTQKLAEDGISIMIIPDLTLDS